jgi:hypothetical protein
VIRAFAGCLVRLFWIDLVPAGLLSFYFKGLSLKVFFCFSSWLAVSFAASQRLKLRPIFGLISFKWKYWVSYVQVKLPSLKTHGCIMKVAVDGYMEVTALLGPGELDVPEEQPLAVIPG